MRNLILPALLVSMLCMGCTNTGAFLSVNETSVNLNEGNYSVSATNITGKSEAGYLFGMSYSSGFMATTAAVVRVAGSGMLYAEALENLWENYESANGTVKNKKVALINVRYDADILNLFIYTKVVITIRADIIEFQ